MSRRPGRLLSALVVVLGLAAQPLFAASGEYRALVLSHNPAAYYPLDETSGTTAFDISGSGLDGTYNNVLLNNAGALGSDTKAAAFDGGSSYVQLPGTWGGAGAVSIEAWVHVDNPNGTQAIVASTGPDFVHLQAGSGFSEFYIDGGSGQNLQTVPDAPPAWHHVVLVISSGSSRLYIDGSQVSTNASPFTSIDSSSDVRIGMGQSPGRFLNGAVDEVAIYNFALSPAQISSHFAAQTDGPLTSIASGNWSSPSTWNNGLVPSNGDDVQISGSHTVTMDTASVTVNNLAVLGVLDLSSFGITVTNDLTAAGTINGSANLTLAGTTGSQIIGLGTVNAPVVFGTGTRELPAGESLTFNGTVTANGSLFNNGEATLTHAAGLAGSGTWSQFSNSVLHVEGPITVTNFNASASGNTVDFTGGSQQVRAATYHHLVATGNFETRTLAGPITVAGDLTIEGGFHDDGQQISGGAGTLTLADFSELHIGTSNGPNAANGTSFPVFAVYSFHPDSDVSYAARASQTVDSTPVYGNLEVMAANAGGTYTKTADGPISVAGSLNLLEFVSDVIFDLGPFSVTVAGDLSGGGTINVSTGTVFIEGSNTAFNGTITPSYAITFSGGNAQTIRGTLYDALTVNKTGGVATLAAPATATFLTVVAGTLFDGNFTLTSNGTVNLGAAATLRIAGSMPAGTHITDPASTVVYEADGNQVIDITPIYGNLIVTTGASPATKTLSGFAPNALHAASLAIVNGPGLATLDLNSRGAEVTGDVTGNGALLLNAGGLEIGGDFLHTGTFDSTSSGVTYNGVGAQIVRGTAYEDLTIDKSGGTATLAGNASVSDELFILDGTFNLGSFALDSQDVVLIDTPGTLELNTGILKIAAYLIIDGGFDSGTTGALWITASSWPAELSGASTAAIAVNSLRITDAAGMSLDGFASYDLTVTGLVELNGGGNIVLESPRKLTVASTGSITRVAGAIQGLLAMQIPAGQTRRFETATQSSNTYSPIEITSTNAATINVLVTDAAATQKVDRFWNLSGDPTTLDLKYEWAYSGYVGDTRGFVPARYFSSTWTFPAGFVDVTGDPNFFAQVNGVTAYEGDWTAGNAGFLGGTLPSIGSFDPTLGAGGTSVTIYGSNFTGATSVTFNGTSDPGFSVGTDNELYATVPAGATTGPIAVTGPGGTGTSFNLFTVAVVSTIQTAQPGNWSNPATWQGGVVPNDWDNAVINHPVTVDAVTIINDVQVNANLLGSFELQVDGTMTWNAGTISADLHIDSGATMELLTASLHELSGSDVDNDGTIELTAASLYLSNGTSIANDGIIDIAGNYDLVWNAIGGIPAIENADSGAILKTAGAALSNLGGNAELNNLGVIRAEAGTLNITSPVTTEATILVELTAGRRISTNPAVSQSFDVANGATLQFSNGANFKTGTGFSGSGTVLILSAVTFEGNSSASATNFIIDANAVIVWSTATFTGGLTWKQGTFTGALTNATGSTIATATGPGFRTLDGITFHNDGTFNLGANVVMTNGASLTNDGASVNLQGDFSLLWNAIGAPAVIQNDGTIAKTAGAGTAEIGGGATFTSNDALRSDSGTLRVSSAGIVDGVVDAANAGTTVEFNNVPSFGDNIVFSGAGMVLVNSGATFTGNVFQTANTLRIDTVGAITMNAVVFNGDLEWKDASIGGDTLSIAAGSTWNVLTGPGTPSFDGIAVTNSGALELTGDSVALANGTSIDNQSSIDIQGDHDFRWNGIGATPSIANSSLIRKSGGSSTSVLGNGGTLTGTGASTIRSDSGTLSVSSPLVTSGTLHASTGAFLKFPNGPTFNSGAIFAGLGEVEVNSSATFSGAISNGVGTTLLSGSANTMTFNGVTWTGPLTWKDVTVNGTGFTINAGSVLTVAPGAATPRLDGGTVTVSGDVLFNDDFGLRNGALFMLPSGSNASIAGDFTIGYDGIGALPTVGLSGNLTKTAGNGTASVSCGGVCTNTATGTVFAAAGTLAFPSGLTSNGTIKFDIGGPVPLIDFGRIAVTGTLTLSGTADAFVDAGYVPDGGTAFQVITFTSRSGDFVTKNYTFAGGTRTLVDTYNTNDLTLTASGPTITSISPTSGGTGGGTSVTINGTGFTGTTPGENFTGTVYFDATLATPVLWQSATQLTATSPAHAAATVNVTVYNANGEAHTELSAFTYGAGTPPTIGTLSVTTGTPNGGTYVEISGTDLATVTQVQFGASNATILSATASLLKVRTPSGVGTVNVVVTSPGGSDTELNAFTYTTPLCYAPVATLAWFRGEGTADDSAGGTNGTNNGGYTPGKIGQAFSLNGTQHVSVPNSTWSQAFDLSLEGWVKFNTVPVGQYAMLFGKTAGAGTFESYGVSYKDSLLYFGVGGPAGITYHTAPFVPSPGVWYHVAMTFDDATNDIRLYVDGQLALAAVETASVAFDAHPLTIGAEYEFETLSFFFDGAIDDVGLYRLQLSAADILAIYDADTSGKCFPASPLVIGISPISGPATGGTPVAITGSSLGSASVTIGGNGLAGITSTQSQINGTTVATAAGTYNVDVTTPQGPATLINGYTFSSPGTYTSVQAGPWNNPTTWGAASFPQSFDSAVLNHDVTLDSDRSVNNLTINGTGTRLSGASILTVTGAMTWNGGDVITPLVLDTGSTTAITGAANRYVQGGVTNNGTVNYDATGQFTLHTSNFTNNGTFNLLGDATWLRFNAPSFINSASGQFNKTGGAGTTTWAGTFTNNGTMTVNAGTLEFTEGYGNNNVANIGPGAMLRLSGSGTSGGTFATGAGTGIVEYSAGNHIYFASFTGSGKLRVSGGVFNQGGGGTVTNFELTGGGTDNAGVMNVSGTFAWSGGDIGAPLILDATCVTSITGAASRNIFDFVTNNGTVTQTATGTITVNSGSFTNNNVFLLQSDGAWVRFNLPLFTNAGTFTKNAGAGTATWDLAFTNNGTVNLSSGSMTFTEAFSNTNTVNINSGVLNLASGGTSSGTFATGAGTGVLEYSAGNSTFSGSLTGTGKLVVSGGQLDITGPTASASNFQLTGGILDGAGAFTVHNVFHWTGGDLSNPGGTMLLGPGSATTITGAANRTVGRALTNQGTITYNATGGLTVHTANLSNSGLIDLQGDGAWSRFNVPVLLNTGTLRKTAGVGTFTIGVNVNNSNGIIDAASGTIAFTEPHTSNASAHYKSGVSSDVAAGTMTFVSVPTLGGAQLTAYIVGVYNPPNGQTWTILSPTSGTFGTTNTTFGAGRSFAVDYPSGTSVRLTASGPTIASVSPTSGSTLGGDTVVITGGGFTNSPAPAVTFDTTNAASVTFNSASQLTVVTPAHAAGAVNVTVTNASSETATLTNGYTYTAGTTALSIAKSAPANVAANEPFTYTITVVNAGPNPATTVSVGDLMQAGMTPSNVIAPSFTCTGTATLTCTAASLATGTHTITFDVTAPSTPQAISNVANLSSANDSTPGDNSATAVTNVGTAQADLQVVKTVGSPTATVGGTVTWTVTVTNNGPSPATAVVITDTLPAGQTVTGATPSGGTCSTAGGIVTCGVGNLAVGNSANVVITATANEGGTRLNQAVADSNETDPNNANDVGTATVVVNGDNTLVVTNSNASGTGSLAQALLDADAGVCPSPCTITFNIPVPAPIPGPLPTADVLNLTIDGTTQPGYAGTPLIQIDGTLAGTGANGLDVDGDDHVIKGLAIYGFATGAGISIVGGQHTFEQNWIGLKGDGTAAANGTGILVNSGSNVIGNSNAALGNVISGNTDAGVRVVFGTANAILGNRIGTGADGVTPRGNGTGVRFDSAASLDLVGGNTIAQNGIGVAIDTVTGIAVLGNSIHSNGGLAIDHDADGAIEILDAGDADLGSNNHQNAPVIASVEITPSDLDVTFSVDSSAVLATNSLRVEVFKADPTGEPQTLLGTQCFAGRNLVNQLMNVPTGSVVGGNSIVATATSFTDGACNATGDGTSEVSAAVTAGNCVPPPVTITGPSSVCNGGSVTLDAGLHSSYLWSPGGATTQTILVSPTSTTTYTVTVTDASGCANSDSHIVTVNNAPPVTIAGPAASCDGNPVTLSATAGFTTYLWQPGNLGGSSITVTPSTTTTYTLTATDSNGCQSSTSHVVTVSSNPAATITASGPTTFCAGGSVILTASAGDSYLWSPGGQTTPSLNVTAAGNYTVTVTNAAGCSTTSAPTTVTVNPTPTVTITGPTATCDASAVTLDAGVHNSYLWSPGGQTSQTITVSPSSTTTYSVTVTNGSGCSATDSHTVAVSGNPTANIVAPTSICSGTSGHNAFVGVHAGATYTWSIANGTITAGLGTSSITFTPSGLAPVQLNVTVATGSCTATGSVTIPVNQSPSTPVITAPANVPASTTGHAASTAPQPGAAYAWSITGGSITSGNGTPSITFASETTTPITLSVTVDIGGCTATSSTTVVVDNATPPPAEEADLSVTKSAPSSVTAGSTFTYTIGVTNAGPVSAVNLSLTDALPQGLTVVSFDTGAWSCGVAGSLFNCSRPSMAPGTSSTILLTVQAPTQPGTIVNSVSVGSAIADSAAFNNTASAATTVRVPPPTCPVNAPSLQAPANGATVNSPVTLSWSSVAGATTYSVWITTEGTTTLAGATPDTSMTLSVGSGVSTWYVVAHGGNACDALTSSTRTFTVQPSSTCGNVAKPQITAPTGAIVGSPVTFGWTPVPQAIGYRVWISVDGTALQDIGATDGPISLTAQVPAGAIVVFVDALFNACPPTRSEGHAFEVAAPDPCAGRGTATLASPANNTTINASSVELRWNAAAPVNGKAPEYRVWASVDGGPFEVRGTTSETSLRDVFDRGRIVWYVQSLYPGCPSTDSGQFAFTIPASQNCGNSRALLIAPNGNTVTGGNVTFLWAGAADAIGFELYLALGSETPALVATLPASTTTLNYIVPEGELTWFVRGLFDRCPPRDSQSATFTYVAPDGCANNDRAEAIAPLAGQPIDAPVDFAWSAPEGAARYELYVQHGNDLPSLVASTTAPEARGIALQNGAYEWFVRTFFNGCSPLDSAPERITIASAPAACAALSAPVVSAPGQISSGAGFLIQWTPSAGATSYQLQLASSADFSGAETINTSATQHAVVRTNSGNATAAVYARVRALDERCTPRPTVTPYGPVSAVFILPQSGAEGSAPLAKKSNVAFTIDLGPELAGQSFVATPNQPWLSVAPPSGVVPAGGRTLVVTADTGDLALGTNLAAVTVTLTTPSSRVSTTGTTSVTSTMTVNLVTPVTPAPKNTPPPDALVIPAVANASGINSKFQSDVRVSNTSAQLMKYQLTFTPSGDGGLAQGRQTTFSIEPGRTVALDDILKSWFGTGSTSATGMLEVRPLTQSATSTPNVPVGALANLVTFASSRTFNVTSNGTFGQHIPAVPFANFIGKGASLAPSVLSLQQIAQSSRYRTNLGLVEGSGESAQLLVKVFGSTGSMLTEFPVNLNGGQHMQLNGVLAQQGINDLTDGRIEVQVAGGNGKVTAYASVLDNETSDPLLVSPVTLGATGNRKWVVPGVADLDNGTANWQTDLRVFNAGTTDVEATLSFYSQNGGAPKTATLTIPAGQVRVLDKTLATVFGTSNDGGAVHIATATDARLIATARTYNLTAQGTYGQFISAVTPAEAAGAGTRPLQLLQVEETNRFRSNIGLAEVTGNPVRLEISVVPPDAKFTARAEVILGANEFRQIGSLLRTVGLTDTHNARVTVRVIEGAGRVAAYASVIDAQTNDPTYVPAQ